MKKGDKSVIADEAVIKLLDIIDPYKGSDNTVKQAANKNLSSILKVIVDNFEHISPDAAATLNDVFEKPNTKGVIDGLLKELPKGTAKEVEGLFKLVAKNCQEKVAYHPALEIARLGVESRVLFNANTDDKKKKGSEKIKEFEQLLTKLEKNPIVREAIKEESQNWKNLKDPSKINSILNDVYAKIKKVADQQYSPKVYDLAISNAWNEKESKKTVQQTFTKRDTRPQPKKYMLNALDHLKALKDQALAKAKEIVPPTRGRKG